ncbi:MAG: hypothetical protein JJU05_02000 [Verrucomicrobia bacterium]|nr:hypothetical protein [Verrucomicrobiota bacterium]MCH8526182.1 hypothetical protein [Kiritimatiellia bacterium]
MFPTPLPSTLIADRTWIFDDVTPDLFVFMPAGLYAGNRFPSLCVDYSPRVPEDRLRGKETPPYITDVPRLRLEEGFSSVQLKSGDLAFPAFGFYDPRSGRGWLAVAEDPAAAADWLWEIEESGDRRRICFRVSNPAVRRSPVYLMPKMQRESLDVPPDQPGVTPSVRIVEGDYATLTDWLDAVFSLRAGLCDGQTVPATVPMSHAFDLIEEHYNRDSWNEAVGVFTTDCNPQSRYPFQTGWCGGMIATQGLLAGRDPLTRTRLLKNLETFLLRAPRPCGLFYGRASLDGEWTPDFAHQPDKPYTHQWTLTRRQGDALLYLIRQLQALGEEVPDAWWGAVRRAADFWVDLWRREGQFGHFLHQETGEIFVGGSASGAVVPAALVAAHARFGDERYLETAEASARMFAGEFLSRGVFTGGPGDAMQNPDSESISAYVESCAALYQATGAPEWLTHGRAAAALAATWVMPYNFPFPAETEFGRHRIHSRGSVFANTQNKHAAPGICTHSGLGLLTLFRATGDERLMDLLRDIVRFMPQTVSRPDRPVHDAQGNAMPSGWINERVNTSDWDHNVGGVFYGSCWCEVSLLLSYAELPGVYARSDSRKIWCLDNVEAEWEGDTLRLRNPTPYPARVKVWIETAEDAAKPLPVLALPGCRLFTLDPA